jgi:hypothetical protein
MALTKLQFRPGVNRETTSYTNEGGWFDMDKVRFRFGFAEKIGGWVKSSSTNFLGTCRALHPWVALDGSSYLGRWYAPQSTTLTKVARITTSRQSV